MTLTLVSQNFALRNKFREFCQKNKIGDITFASSKNALTYFEKNMADYVFVDFLLSSFDGLELLKNLAPILKSVFIVPKNFKTIIKKAKDFGAFKVVDHDFLFEQVLFDLPQKNDEKPKTDLEDCVSKLCIEVGITPYLSGYKFVKEAILLMVSNPERYKNVTRTLYPKIAEKFESSATRVERSIRHALNSTNAIEKMEKLNNFLDIKAIEKGERITNSQFILTVADRLLYKFNVQNGVCG